MTTTDDNITLTTHPFEGLTDSGERLAKAQLARQINTLLKSQGLKQADAAALLGVTQPEVSQLANGRPSGFTFDRLYRCLYALNMDVEIVIKEHIPTNDNGAGIAVFA